MRLRSVLRLGLRQFAAGMLSVLALGVLNRVMKAELGVELGIVGLIVGAHFFAAPLAVPVGHLSDRLPLFGRRRTPYILIGALLTSTCVALTPFVAFAISERGTALLPTLLGMLFFFIMGAGMYTSGAAYLALLSDLTPEAERGRAVSIIWSMLMAGILAGVALSVLILDQYSRARLVLLFQVMALLQIALTLIAVWAQEPRQTGPPVRTTPPLAEAVRTLLRGRQSRRFFCFLAGAIFFLFLQQAVLEPFGADVFGMSVRETTSFNAYQMVGVLAGMAVGGAVLARRLGTRRTAALGLLLSALAFAGLVGATLETQPTLVRPSILALGLGMGLFTVGGLSLMMDMSAAGRIGISMGAWTLAEAVANGLATAGGGVLHDLGQAIFAAEGAGYATVFTVEAVGVAAMVLLLRRINTAAYRAEVLASPSTSPGGSRTLHVAEHV